MRKNVIMSFAFVVLSFMVIYKAQANDNIYNVSTKYGMLRLTETEWYVMQKIGKGDAANLVEQFGSDENKRELRAWFLRFIIIEMFKEKKCDIMIIGAVIRGKVDIRMADIDNNIALYNCIFNSYVDLSNNQFKGYLKLNGTQFHGDVHFNSTKFYGSLEIDNATYHRMVDFTGANIGEQFSANSAHFLNKDLEIKFNGMNVGKEANFKDAKFYGPVDFTKAKIERDLIADNVKFKSKNFKIKFDELAVKGYFSLGLAQFDCPVSFMGIDIGLGLNASDALFKNREPVMFGLMKSKLAVFNGAFFQGPADFSMINIEETLMLNVERGNKKTIFKSDATFNAASIGKYLFSINAEFNGQASFIGVKVGVSTTFENSVFRGLVNFTSANLGSSGLSFKGANFLSPEGMVSFNSIKVVGNGNFVNTKFLGPVDFSAADIEGHLEFREAKFLNKDKYILFMFMRVGQSTFFDKTVFKGSPSFFGANFKEQVYAQETHFENSILCVNFSNSRIGQNLNMEKSIFRSKINFENADIGGSLVAREAKLLTKGNEASFIGLKVGKDIDLSNSIFEGLANFEHAHVMENVNLYKAVFKEGVLFRNVDIKRNLYANESSYLNDKLANFNGIKVGDCIFLKKAKFEGPVDFISAHIGWQLLAENAQFKTNGTIDFNGIKVGNSVFFREAEFKGLVDLGTAEINGNLEANKAKFLNKKEQAKFFNLKVGRSVSLNNTEFWGGVDFYGSSVGMDLNAEGTKFLSEDSDIEFKNIKVANQINFDNAVFKSALLLMNGNLGNLRISGKPDNDQAKRDSVRKIDLCWTVVDKKLIIENVDIDILEATNMQSNSNTILKDVNIKETIDFTNSKFRIFNLINVNFPKKRNPYKESIYLDNFIYEAIYAETDQKIDDWRKIIDLLENSQFNYQNYKRLSSYYEKSGYTDRASEVIKKGEELYLERMPWYKRYPYEYLWGFLTGYGRDLTWACIFALLFIVIGVCAFNPRFLKKENDNRWQWTKQIKQKSYVLSKIINYSITTRLIISLDQFMPGSPLGIGKSWEVSRGYYWQFIYYNAHKLLGWILIPLILTAIYTRLK